MVCICAMVAASCAAELSKKRGIFVLPEADAMNNHVVEEFGFNGDASNGGGMDSGSQYNDYNNNNNRNHFKSSSQSDIHPSPLATSFNVASFSSGSQSNYNGAQAHTSGYVRFPPYDNVNNRYDHQGSNGRYVHDYSSSLSFNAAPSQHLERPHELVKIRHSESTEKGQFPVHVPRTIVKTNYIEHPVPQVSPFLLWKYSLSFLISMYLKILFSINFSYTK